MSRPNTAVVLLQVLTAAVTGAALGAAVRGPVAAVLCAACAVVIAGVLRLPEVVSPAWPAAPADLPGQVGHPLVSRLIAELEQAADDTATRTRLTARAAAALDLRPPERPPRRAEDLYLLLRDLPAEQARRTAPPAHVPQDGARS